MAKGFPESKGIISSIFGLSARMETLTLFIIALTRRCGNDFLMDSYTGVDKTTSPSRSGLIINAEHADEKFMGSGGGFFFLASEPIATQKARFAVRSNLRASSAIGVVSSDGSVFRIMAEPGQ